MSLKPCVLVGEAQQSDSEEEIDCSAVSNDQVEQCKGKVVVGEAPESDEESFDKKKNLNSKKRVEKIVKQKTMETENKGSIKSISSAASALSAPTVIKKKKSKEHQSILIKKLYEKNVSLYKNLTDFIKQTSANAGNELNAADKKLLKCQMQLQEGADYLKVINSNLTALDTYLQMFLSTKFLPDIRVEKNIEKVNTKPP